MRNATLIKVAVYIFASNLSSTPPYQKTGEGDSTNHCFGSDTCKTFFSFTSVTISHLIVHACVLSHLSHVLLCVCVCVREREREREREGGRELIHVKFSSLKILLSTHLPLLLPKSMTIVTQLLSGCDPDTIGSLPSGNWISPSPFTDWPRLCSFRVVWMSFQTTRLSILF